MHSMHVPQGREPACLPEQTGAGRHPRFQASDAEFAAARAALAGRLGRRLPQTQEEEEAAERAARAAIDGMQARCERRQRALDAYRAKARTRRPRRDRPAPKDSRQYAPAMATTAVRDGRLVMGARACLQLIRALIGRAASRLITKAVLARTLGVSMRTIQRYLSAARTLGYITTMAVFDATGRQIGQRISITEKLRPYWEAAKSSMGLGETGVSSNKVLKESTNNQPHACREDVARSARSSERKPAP